MTALAEYCTCLIAVILVFAYGCYVGGNAVAFWHDEDRKRRAQGPCYSCGYQEAFASERGSLDDNLMVVYNATENYMANYYTPTELYFKRLELRIAGLTRNINDKAFIYTYFTSMHQNLKDLQAAYEAKYVSLEQYYESTYATSEWNPRTFFRSGATRTPAINKKPASAVMLSSTPTTSTAINKKPASAVMLSSTPSFSTVSTSATLTASPELEEYELDAYDDSNSVMEMSYIMTK